MSPIKHILGTGLALFSVANLLADTGKTKVSPPVPDGESMIVLEDFESGSWGDWTVEGNAFGRQPFTGTKPPQVLLGRKGEGAVNSWAVGGDGATGDGSIVVPSGNTEAVAAYESASGKPETKAEHDARMRWWREARYGLFIHWSLSSVYAGEWKGKPSGGDWIMERVKAPVAEYAEGAKRFTAENFNADEWVALAKAGGMKYIVITAKHHDGFTMFPSKASKFNIHDATPFKRDPMAELAAACRREGLKFGIYYSQAQDWHHAGGYKPTGKWGPNQIGCEPGVSWDPAQDGDPDAYVKNIAAVHIREIVENYQPDIFWWDYPTQMPEESVKALRAPLADLPNVIVNCRLGNGVKGDFSTFEFSIPEEKTIGRDWETCTNMNKSWGYRRLDFAYRPASELLREFIEIMSRGGNYLLNIGPDSTGTIPEPQIERITQIGEWLRKNAEFVYGTEAVKIGWQPKNQWLVSKDGAYYLHVTGWGKQAARLPGLSAEVVSATTTTGESLVVEKDGEGITTITPPAAPDPLGTVVILKLAGTLETRTARAECSPRPDGSLLLLAKDAALAEKMRLGSAGGQPVFRNWVNPSQIPTWKLMVPQEAAGEYRVTLVYSCEEAEAGSTFELTTGKSKVAGTVESTGDVQTVKRFDLPGLLRLEAGPQILSIAPLKIAKNSVANLRDITLTPVKK
jgi:alpha-L-fucosidase